MKKYLIPLLSLILLAGCGGGNDKDATVAKKPADITTDPDYQKGLTLVSQSDCLTCHKPAEKLTGPAYQEVANRYAGSDTAIKYLVNKIKTGGQGKWGTIPMAAHPNLSDADAEQMVKYILLLKTN